MPREPRTTALRSDAARNRETLLRVAGRLVASKGVTVPLDEIVREAGSSSGTLYRHFPTRSDLMRSLYDRIVDRTDALVERARSMDTGWRAIVAYVDGVVGIADEHPESPAVIAYIRQHEPEYRPGDQWLEPMREAVRRAREEGALREDATETDVAYVPHLLVPIVRWPEPQRGVLLARMRSLLLDALRPVSGRRVPLPLEPLSVMELRALSETAPPPPGI